MQADLLAGKYRFSALQHIRGREKTLDLWSAMDALVLKALALVLGRHLKPHLSKHCYHLACHGAAKAAVRTVRENLTGNTFVFRTDVRSYYANIDHDVLFRLLQKHVKEKKVLDLLQQYLKCSINDGGLFRDVCQGICLGSPLSPVMAALYLQPLDALMAQTGLFYARFMDDWVVLAPTRWQLRRVINAVNETLVELKITKHPDKTFIGRISKGFDFLGYRFSPRGLAIAPRTMIKFVERITRLYEQGASESRIGVYVYPWLKWATAGLSWTGREISDG